MKEKSFFEGRWKVVEEIGQGTTGTVYKVLNSRGGVNSYAAIKEILLPKEKKEILNMYSQGATDSDITEYFENKANEWIAKEVNFLEQFKGNPNIVAIEDYDVLEREDMLGRIVVIRMELLETLEDYILTHEVTDKEMIKMGLSILNALTDCEERNVLHRDIKPQNVFVNKNHIFKLGDFSESKEIEKTVSNMTQRGTPNYMAPELYKGERGSKSIDTYSLGIMLYQYFNNNRLPFMPEKYKFEDAQKVLERRMNGEALPNPKNAPEELSRIILKACSYKPEDRYKSAMEFKEDLQKVYDEIKTPTVLFGARQNTNERVQETVDDKTVGIYSDENTSTKKSNKRKGQFGEDLVEEEKKAEVKKERKEEVVEKKEEKKNYNETVGIFYESSKPTMNKQTTKKKQFGTEEEIEEKEEITKEKKEEKTEEIKTFIVADKIDKRENMREYHTLGDLQYSIINTYSAVSPKNMYTYVSGMFYFEVGIYQLPSNIKTEQEFMNYKYEKNQNCEIVSSKQILINDTVWYEFSMIIKEANFSNTLRVRNLNRNLYVKKIKDYFYDVTFMTSNILNQKIKNNFTLYVLNSLKINKNIYLKEKVKEPIERLRTIDEDSIIKLEKDLTSMKEKEVKSTVERNQVLNDLKLKEENPKEASAWKFWGNFWSGVTIVGFIVLITGMIIPGLIMMALGVWADNLVDKHYREKLSNKNKDK